MPRRKYVVPEADEVAPAQEAAKYEIAIGPEADRPPMGPDGGRPVMLTRERRKVMLEAIAKGMPIEAAASLAGITKRVWYKWQTRAFDPTETHPFWTSLAQQIEQARAISIKKALDRIDLAAQNPQHWTAGAWLLERSDPAHFGRNTTVNINYRSMDERAFLDALTEAGLGGLVVGPDETGVIEGSAETWLQLEAGSSDQGA